jgi:hypothetical protein
MQKRVRHLVKLCACKSSVYEMSDLMETLWMEWERGVHERADKTLKLYPGM